MAVKSIQLNIVLCIQRNSYETLLFHRFLLLSVVVVTLPLLEDGRNERYSHFGTFLDPPL